MSNPKTWWTLLENEPGSHEFGRISEFMFNIPGSFEIVAKSAYYQAIKECDQLRSQVNALQEDLAEVRTARDNVDRENEDEIIKLRAELEECELTRRTII